MIKPNRLKEIFKKGNYAIGTFIKFNDPAIAEILGLVGYDFFVLDNEHVSMNKHSMVDMITAANTTQIVPIIRVKKNEDVEILQALDSGALGVQVPNVDTAEEAMNLVNYVKYTPIGSRGFSPSVRAAHYGLMDKFKYVTEANENTLIIAHCETKTCVDNIDQLLEIPEIDVIFIGPMDLSQSLGVIGQANHPLVIETIETIITKVRKSNKIVGIVATEKTAPYYIEKGVQYLLISTDQGMLISSAQKTLKALKKI